MRGCASAPAPAFACRARLRTVLPAAAARARPAENPITEPKRVLGKILFWDEQLSADDSVACGTCHRPAYGGADPRAGRYPGVDKGTIDDVRGSPGIVSLDSAGRRVAHPVFGAEPQVTARVAPSYFGALWADELFWDGRAGSVLEDPLTARPRSRTAARSRTRRSPRSQTPLRWPSRAHVGRAAAKLARVEPSRSRHGCPWTRHAAPAAQRRDPGAASRRLPATPPSRRPCRIACVASYERTSLRRNGWDRYEAGDTSVLGRARCTVGARFKTSTATRATRRRFTSNEFFQMACAAPNSILAAKTSRTTPRTQAR
jgi:hypothetical protein